MCVNYFFFLTLIAYLQHVFLLLSNASEFIYHLFKNYFFNFLYACIHISEVSIYLGAFIFVQMPLCDSITFFSCLLTHFNAPTKVLARSWEQECCKITCLYIHTYVCTYTSIYIAATLCCYVFLIFIVNALPLSAKHTLAFHIHTYIHIYVCVKVYISLFWLCIC